MMRSALLIPLAVALLGADWLFTGCVQIRKPPESVEELTRRLRPEFERNIRFRSFPGWYETDPPARPREFRNKMRRPLVGHHLEWDESGRRIIYSPCSEATCGAPGLHLTGDITAAIPVRDGWLVSQEKDTGEALRRSVSWVGKDGTSRELCDLPIRSFVTSCGHLFGVGGGDIGEAKPGIVVEFIPARSEWEHSLIAELPQCA